jgi:hypothetical protein
VIGAFVAAVHDIAIERFGRIEEGSELDEWLRWATQQADRIDPLMPNPPSVLDETL